MSGDNSISDQSLSASFQGKTAMEHGLGGADQTAVTKNSLTRTELIAALDGQIKDIEEESKRPGWSIWALLGAVCTLIWLAVGQYSQQSNFQAVGLFTIFWIIFAEIFVTIFFYRDETGSRKPKPLRLRTVNEDPNAAKGLLFFFLLRTVALWTVDVSLDSSLQVATLTWYFGLTTVLIGLLLVLTFVNQRAPNQTALSDRLSRQIPTFKWIVVFWSALICYGLIQKIQFLIGGFTVSDFRLGLLLAGIVGTVQIIVTGDKDRPTVDRLKRIRRDLAFGRITVEEAETGVDVVLLGLHPSASISQESDELSGTLEKIRIANETIIANCQNAESILDALEDERMKKPDDWIERARRVGGIVGSTATQLTLNQTNFNHVFSKMKNIAKLIEICKNKGQILSAECTAKWIATIDKGKPFFNQFAAATKLHESIKLRFINLPKGEEQE